MNFIDVVFFVKVCELGYERAKQELGISSVDADSMITSIQSFIKEPLFLGSELPTFDNLSDRGKVFLPVAKKMVSDLLPGFSQNATAMNGGENLLKVKADVTNGKNVVLPSITNLEHKARNLGINVELFTHEDHKRLKNLDMHVIFHNTEKADKLLFDKRWSLRVEQGLYASERYLKDSGNIPESANDLLSHAVLGLGDSFDRDVYSRTNWHLSEKYMGIQLTPAMMINSRSVLMAAIRTHLGIGSVIEYQRPSDMEGLCRVLPNLKGPPVTVDFFVRKNLNKRYLEYVDCLEQEMLKAIAEAGLEVIY